MRAKGAGKFLERIFPPNSSKLRSDYLFSFQKRTNYLFPAFSRSEYLFQKSASPPPPPQNQMVVPLRLFRETAPFQSPFTARIGIRMTYSHLKPPGPQGVIEESILPRKRGIAYMVI